MRSAHYAAPVIAVAAAFIGYAATQSTPAYQTHNLTPDGFWHNRYHALLSMAAYGDYNTLCPNQTFSNASEHKNFPNSTRAPWTVIETWGPTASGSEGYTAIVPEMNKVVTVFKGNYDLEQTLDTDVSSWSLIGSGIGSACKTCTVNSFALQGYLEARNATDNWNLTRNAYYGSGLVYSITGHGLGGMHALIASVDFNYHDICYYSHNYGTPRTFNEAGATYYNVRFNGEAGERATFNNDVYGDSIPAGPNYYHAGTAFYYYGTNMTNVPQPNWNICWDDNNDNPDDPACQAQPQPGLNTTSAEDHYYYFTPVGQCGLPDTYAVGLNPVDQFIEFEEASPLNSVAEFSWSSPTPTSTSHSRTSSSSYHTTHTSSSHTTASPYTNYKI